MFSQFFDGILQDYCKTELKYNNRVHQFLFSFKADPDGAGFDLELPPIPIIIGSIPHKVAFPNFDVASSTDDNDGGPNEGDESKVVSLPQNLQEKIPKLPGVVRGCTSTASKMNKNRKVFS